MLMRMGLRVKGSGSVRKEFRMLCLSYDTIQEDRVRSDCVKRTAWTV